jgi:hypothetical protein
MAQLEEVLAGEPAAEDVVDDDRGDMAGRAAMVEQHERDAAIRQPFEIAPRPSPAGLMMIPRTR